jgi:hypothetical protein
MKASSDSWADRFAGFVDVFDGFSRGAKMKLGIVSTLAAALAIAFSSGTATAEGIRGDYLETRSCDVYTGPCFANAELGLTGRQAIMAWSIDEGDFQGVDLSGLKVIMVVRSADTLGFGVGIKVRNELNKSVILLDSRATAEQLAALEKFARAKAGATGGQVTRVASLPIEMKLDHVEMVATLKAGNEVNMLTRKLKKGDCVCTNEQIYYPPLIEVENSEPAYTMASAFQGRGLGASWTHSQSRSSFLATFAE